MANSCNRNTAAEMGYCSNKCFVTERTHKIRSFRRTIPIHQNNRTILTAFFTFSVIGFLVIYLEVARLLVPHTVLSARDLHRLTQGFANDVPSSRDHLPPIRPTLSRRKPSAIVVGFRHCGAEHLLDLMAQHPDVVVNRKDLRFFEANRTKQWYISKMPLTLPRQVTVDTSLDYATRSTAHRSIAEFDKEMRIIVVVCKPLTRLILRAAAFDSSHNHRSISFSLGADVVSDRNSSSKTATRISIKARSSGVDSNQALIEEVRQIKNKTGINNNYNARAKTDSVNNRNPRSVSSKNSSDKDHYNIFPKSHRNKTTFTEGIRSYIKSHVLDHSSKRTSLNTSFLVGNGDYINHLSKVYATFPRSRVHLIHMDSFHHSTSTEWASLLEFLGVKYKELPAEVFHKGSNDVSDMNMPSGNHNFMKSIPILYDRLQREDPQMLHQLEDFYSPFNKELSTFLNKSP